MSHFTHLTGGDLARRLAMEWMKIRSPKMPTLVFKREVESEDTGPHKRRRISEPEESFESVNSIEDEVEEFNPFLSDSSHRKSAFFCSGSNKENSPEPSFKESKNFVRKELSKEAIVESKEGKKCTSPALAPSTSSTSNSITRIAEQITFFPLQTRLQEISMRIAKAKAEKEAKHRKTVIIAEHDYTNSRRRSHLSK